MAHQEFDRFAINMEPLSSRDNKKRIEQDHVPIDQKPKKLSAAPGPDIGRLAPRNAAP